MPFISWPGLSDATRYDYLATLRSEVCQVLSVLDKTGRQIHEAIQLSQGHQSQTLNDAELEHALLNPDAIYVII